MSPHHRDTREDYLGALKHLFQKFFERNPDIYALQWAQAVDLFDDSSYDFQKHPFSFQPYTCTHSDCRTDRDLERACADARSEPFEVFWFPDDGRFQSEHFSTEEERALAGSAEAVRDFERVCHGAVSFGSDGFKDAFGEECTVVATRDGFHVEESSPP